MALLRPDTLGNHNGSLLADMAELLLDKVVRRHCRNQADDGYRGAMQEPRLPSQ
ncbi:hypothetical protein D9M72_628270 [compost metagenome]